MNRNQLKIIACLSMLVDHIGLILFPDIEFLRLTGRLAMPVFAFFIGEGCYYTKNKKAYFLRVFILGLVCQSVYIAEAMLNGGNGSYLNILLTFACSIPICYLFMTLQKRFDNEKTVPVVLAVTVLTVGILEKAVCLLFDTAFGIELIFDYGFTGMCLPMFVLLGRSKREKILGFSVGLALFCCVNYAENLPWALSALMSIPLMYAYNGKGGERNLKYFFYAFYPLHLAVIYGLDMLI